MVYQNLQCYMKLNIDYRFHYSNNKLYFHLLLFFGIYQNIQYFHLPFHFLASKNIFLFLYNCLSIFLLHYLLYNNDYMDNYRNKFYHLRFDKNLEDIPINNSHSSHGKNGNNDNHLKLYLFQCQQLFFLFLYICNPCSIFYLHLNKMDKSHYIQLNILLIFFRLNHKV